MRITLVLLFIVAGSFVIHAQRVAFTKLVDEDAIFKELSKYPYGSKKQKEVIDSISSELYKYTRDLEIPQEVRQDVLFFIGNMHSYTGSIGQRLNALQGAQDTVTHEVRQLATKLKAHQDSITRILCALKSIMEDDQQPRRTRELAVKTFTREPRPGVLKYVLKYRDSLVFGEYNEWDDHFQSTMTTATNSLREFNTGFMDFNKDSFYGWDVNDSEISCVYLNNRTINGKLKDKKSIELPYWDEKLSKPLLNTVNSNNWSYIPFIIEYFDEYQKANSF